MGIMGEVLLFKQKKELPKAIEEVNSLVVSAYADGIEKAINKLAED